MSQFAYTTGMVMVGVGLLLRGWPHLKQIRHGDYSHLDVFLGFVGAAIVFFSMAV